ncbi:hypothetical protein [Vagococcus sp. WN89Y]
MDELLNSRPFWRSLVIIFAYASGFFRFWQSGLTFPLFLLPHRLCLLIA